MSVRPYQKECILEVESAWRAGENRQLASMPTGTGKARTLGILIKRLLLRDPAQVFVLAHRDEIIDQLAETMREQNPGKTVGIERAEESCDPIETDIVVASVATVGRAKEIGQGRWDYCDRLSKFNRNWVRYIFPDEAHHSTADTYLNVFRYFKCLKGDPATDDPSKLLVGWTATPNRGDNIGLERVFGRLVFWRDIRSMIDQGWLAPIRAYRVDTDIDISGVKTRQGDFVVKELERVINVQKRNELILQKYLEFGEKMGFFCFTVDVQHSEDMAALFRRNGIEAYPISYKTPKNERRSLIEALRARKIDGLCSCNAVTEGTDVPAVAVGLMTRPTKSSLLLTQCLGRVLRPYPSPEELGAMLQRGEQPEWAKPYAVVLDFVDVCGKHRLCGVPSLFGLRQDYRFTGKSVTEELKEIDDLGGKAKGLDLTKYSSLYQMRAAVEAIDLFAVPTVPEVAKRMSKLAWTSNYAGGYNLSLPEKLSFQLRENTLGQWEAYKNIKGVREFLRTLPSLDLAFQFADKQVPADQIGAVLAKAKWRNDEATPDQITALAKLRSDMRRRFPNFAEFRAWVLNQFTKGDVSALLTEAIEKRKRGAYR